MDHIYHYALHMITNLGDSGFLTVVAFLAAAYLYFIGNQRAAGALCFALISCLLLMTLLKIGFIACHQLIPSWHIRSPSGHAAMAAAIWGTLAAIIASHFEGWKRVLAPVLAALLVLFIALSRLLLHAHTLNEVLLGLFLGSLIAFLGHLMLKNAPKIAFKARFLALIIAFSMLLIYGARTPAEGLITRFAHYLRDTYHMCLS